MESTRNEVFICLWQDVAAAYDAGMQHAVEHRESARRQLQDAGVRILRPYAGAKVQDVTP